MSSITIRNLDESVKRGLRVRAAQHGHSMEEEARIILRAAIEAKLPDGAEMLKRIRDRFAPLGDVDLPQPTREVMRKPPDWPASE